MDKVQRQVESDLAKKAKEKEKEAVSKQKEKAKKFSKGLSEGRIMAEKPAEKQKNGSHFVEREKEEEVKITDGGHTESG